MKTEFWMILSFTAIFWYSIHRLTLFLIRKSKVKNPEFWSSLFYKAESGAMILGFLVLCYQVFQYGYLVNWIAVSTSIFTGAVLGSLKVIDRLAFLINLVISGNENHN